MVARLRCWLIGAGLLAVAGLVAAQTPPLPPPPTQTPKGAPEPLPPPKAPVEKPPPADAVAATVNGQNISEMAVYRGLLRVAPAARAKVRKEVLNFLIDNTIIDQYLAQLKVAVDTKEIDAHVTKIRTEAKKDGQDFEKLLNKLHLTEAELRRELHGALRWDKFILQQGTDKVLRNLFAKNLDMFNGSRMHARHILVPIETGKSAAAQAKAAALRKQVEADVAQQMAKLPSTTDALMREKERVKTLEKVFADLAAKESSCPSKKQGGDLGYFPRAGAMVEPFARAAFALKPYQLSEPVATEFGYHLILALDHKPGKDVKFEDVKPFVQEVYGERMREAILAQYKARSRIVISEPKKK